MAIADMVNSQLRLTYVTGNDEITGEPIHAYKSFNNVKTNAEASQLFTIAQSLSNLQSYSLYKVERNDRSEIRPAN